jgi:hypothetical protein
VVAARTQVRDTGPTVWGSVDGGTGSTRGTEATLVAAERTSGGGWTRVVLALALAAAVIAPVATIAAWAAVDADSSHSDVLLGRRGVQYLKPLTALLGALVDGQSAAVRGEPVDAAPIKAHLDAVEDVERQHGAALGTRSRWQTLRDSVVELSERPGGAGIEAYQRWSQAVDLTVALMRRVGDTSKLILGPALDSYYLMDAGLLRLPDVIQGSGQLADLLAMTAANRTALDELRAAVVRDRVATASAAVNSGLGKVVDSTSSGRVSAALLAPLDQFGAAADALAPSVAVAVMPPLPTNVVAASVGVRVAADRLAQTVWDELDGVLANRADELARRRLYMLLIALVGVIAGILVGMAGVRRGRNGQDNAEPPPPAYAPPPVRPESAIIAEDPVVSALQGPRAPAGAR